MSTYSDHEQRLLDQQSGADLDRIAERRRPTLTLMEAYEVTRAAYPQGWRLPPTNEIDAARAAEAKEEWQREADEYSANGSGSINWEGT